MKTKKSNIYSKAVKYYENGELDKAIKLCDECISENLKNGSALNLKGLILYSKGNLEGARAQWKINSDYNDNPIAKNYLFDSLKDIERLKLYKEAEKDIKELRIDEAIKKLLICKESDFNSIKVDLALAVCCLRKAKYSECSTYLTKVLSIDKHNETAKKLIKDLKSYDDVKVNVNSSNNYMKYIIVAAICFCILISAMFTVKLINNKNKESDIEIAENFEKENEEHQQVEENMNDSEDKGETKNEEKINFTELSKSIDEKDYDDVYDKLQKISNDSLTGQEKSIYYKGKELLSKEGVEYYYKKGYELYQKKHYREASEEFLKGCTYGQENYLYQHLVFYNAASYEALKDSNNAIKYYEIYYKQFHDSDYIAEAIYKLAILYKNVDIDKSVAYAKEIRKDYSSSMYNNDIISDLIDSIK